MSHESVSVFVSYAHADDDLRKSLRYQLKGLGYVDVWDDREINAGSEWSSEIASQMDSADIILLLISPEFIASDFVRTMEIPNALARHVDGTARVIPVLLRPCPWKGEHIGIGGLQAFPSDEKWATTEWGGSLDAALLSVVNGIERVAEELANERRIRMAEQRSVVTRIGVQLLRPCQTAGSRKPSDTRWMTKRSNSGCPMRKPRR